MHRHLFSVDPGENNNGFCYFKYNMQEKKADTKIMKVCSREELEDILKVVWGIRQASANASITFVVENFRVDSKARNAIFQWSEMETIRVIGALELAAKWCGANIVLQEPGSVWPLARKWAIPYPFKRINKHPEDDKSAWCHGAKYMMDKKWINTVDQISMFGQERL